MVVYIAVLFPIALVSIHNLITFDAVMKSICRRRPGVVHPRRKHYSIFVQRCRQSFSLSCVLGFTWVFGFFAIHTASMVFKWLFCIFNSLQGVLYISVCISPILKHLHSLDLIANGVRVEQDLIL